MSVFSAFSMTDWWDEQGPFRALHALNPTRLAYLRGQLPPLAGLRVADIGCGAGLVSEALARQGARVEGFDEDPAVIKVARDHARVRARQKIDLQKIDLQKMTLRYRVGSPPRRARYDAVVAMEVIEHVADPRAFVDHLAALLRPGGRLVLSTLNRTLASRLGAIVLAERVLRWVAPGTHDFHRFIKPHELATWVEASGLQVVDVCGFVYRPLSFLPDLSCAHRSEPWRMDPHNLRVNYALTARRQGTA